MSKENVTAFRKLIDGDAAVQREVEAASASRAIQGIIDVGQRHGFSFTAQEMFGVLGGAELSSFELDLISGGVAQMATNQDCGKQHGAPSLDQLQSILNGQTAGP